MSSREMKYELLYSRLSDTDKGIVDKWDSFPADDRTYYWTVISPSARRLLYMFYDGKVGLL